MLTAARVVIVAMLLFNVLRIVYSIYRLSRPSTRPAPLLFMLLVRLLTRIDPSDLRRPREVSLLLQRRRRLSAFRGLGAGIGGLTLTTICLALGNAAPLPNFSWSSAETMPLVRLVVTISLGMAGASVGTYIGGSIGQIVGMARLNQSISAPSLSGAAPVRFADLASPVLRYFSWAITTVTLLLTLGAYTAIELYTSMRPSQLLQTLWPMAIPSLLLTLYTVSAEMFGRQPYMQTDIVTEDAVVEEMRHLVPSINDLGRRLAPRQVYDVRRPLAPLISQLVLTICILVPLSRHGMLTIGAVSSIGAIATMLAYFLLDSLLAQARPSEPLLNDIRAARSAVSARVPWRWRRPNVPNIQ